MITYLTSIKKVPTFLYKITTIIGSSSSSILIDDASETKSFLKGILILRELMLGGSIISTFSIRKRFQQYIKNINTIVGSSDSTK
jgi:hypothetical protein